MDPADRWVLAVVRELFWVHQDDFVEGNLRGVVVMYGRIDFCAVAMAQGEGSQCRWRGWA